MSQSKRLLSHHSSRGERRNYIISGQPKALTSTFM